MVKVVAQVNDSAFDTDEAPDSGLGSGTPQEQATPEAPAAPPKAPQVVDPAFQREFTQTRQKWSAVVGALGLEKDAPVDVVTARLAELQSPRGPDDETYDPEVARRIKAVENREWAAEERLHGDLALHARTLVEKLRKSSNMSPSDVVDTFYAAVEAAVTAQRGTQETEEAAPEQTQPTFGQEAPLTQRTPGGIDTTGLADLSSKEREDRTTSWLDKQLERFAR